MADEFYETLPPEPRLTWRAFIAPTLLVSLAVLAVWFWWPRQIEIPAADVPAPAEAVREKVEWPIIYDFPVTDVVVTQDLPPVTLPPVKPKRRKTVPVAAKPWHEEFADTIGWNTPARPWAPNLHFGWPH